MAISGFAAPTNSLVLATSVFLLVLLSPSASFVHPDMKTTHLHFYFHDNAYQPNQTAIWIINSPNDTNQLAFGNTAVFNTPLTKEANLSSEILGWSQGTYTVVSQDPAVTVLLLTANMIFTQGEFNGSTLAIQTRRPFMLSEVPIIGGTGRFRLARGYAFVNTVYLNATAGIFMVEYNVTVFHY